MSFLYRESTVLAVLLVLIAALVPIFIADNTKPAVIHPNPSSPAITPGASHTNIVHDHRTLSTVSTSLADVRWRDVFFTILGVILTLVHAIITPATIILSGVLVVLYPAILAFKFMFAIISFPFKIVYMVFKALYPVYVFLGAACIVGLTTGVVGKETLRGIVRLWRTKPEDQVEGYQEPAARGRNRKRKDVGAQPSKYRRRVKR